MRQLVLITLVVLTFFVSTPSHALFGRIAAEKQRRLETERKLSQEQHLTAKWQNTSFVLGVLCVITLVAGAAIGSKGRQDAKPKK